MSTVPALTAAVDDRFAALDAENQARAAVQAALAARQDAEAKLVALVAAELTVDGIQLGVGNLSLEVSRTSDSLGFITLTLNRIGTINFELATTQVSLNTTDPQLVRIVLRSLA